MDFVQKLRQNLIKHQTLYSGTIDKYSQIEDESKEVDWPEDEEEEYEFSDGDSNENVLEFNDNDTNTKNLVSQVCSTAKDKLLTSTPVQALNPLLNCEQATIFNNNDLQLKITPIRADDLQMKNIVKKTNTFKNILTTVLERNLFKNKEKNQTIASDDDCVIIIDDVDVQSQVVLNKNKENCLKKDRKTICIDETKLILNNDFSFIISQSKPDAQSTPYRFKERQLPTRTIEKLIIEESNKNCSRSTPNEQHSSSASLKIVPNTQQSPSSTIKIVPNTQPINESLKQKKPIFSHRFIDSRNNHTINMSNLLMIPDSQPSEINESKTAEKQNTFSNKIIPNTQLDQNSTNKTKPNIDSINESIKISNNQKHSVFLNRFTCFKKKQLPNETIEMLIDEHTQPSSTTKIVPNTQPINESLKQKVFVNRFIDSKNNNTINMSNLSMIPDTQPSGINEPKTAQKTTETENRRVNSILNEIFGNSTNEKSTINVSISKTVPDSQPSMTFVSQMINKTIQQNTTVSIIPDTQATLINKSAFNSTLMTQPNKINETKFDNTMEELLSRSNQNKSKLIKVVENTLPNVNDLPRLNGKELKRTNLDRSKQNDSDLQIQKKCKYQNETEDEIIVIEDSPIKQSTETAKNDKSKLGNSMKKVLSNVLLNSSSNDSKQKESEVQSNYFNCFAQKALKSSSKLLTFKKTDKQSKEVLNDASPNQVSTTENDILKKLKPNGPNINEELDLFDSENVDPEQIKKTKILDISALNKESIKMNLNENDSQKERVLKQVNSTTDKTIDRSSVNNDLFDTNDTDESRLLRARNPLEYKKKDLSSKSINKSTKETKESKPAQDDSFNRSEYEPEIKNSTELTLDTKQLTTPSIFQSNDLSKNSNKTKNRAPQSQLSRQMSNNKNTLMEKFDRINGSKIENQKSVSANLTIDPTSIQNDYFVSEAVELEIIKPQSTCKKKNDISDLFDSEEIESEQENLQIKNKKTHEINIVNNETNKKNEIITKTVNKENKEYNMKPIKIHSSLKRTSSSASVGNQAGFIFCGTFIKAPVPNDSVHDISNTKNKIIIRSAINKTADKSNQSVDSSSRRSDIFDLKKFLSDTFNKTKT